MAIRKTKAIVAFQPRALVKTLLFPQVPEYVNTAIARGPFLPYQNG
jgi:hypothetical protein